VSSNAQLTISNQHDKIVNTAEYIDNNNDDDDDDNNNNNSYMTSPWGPASQSWFSRESAEASLHMEFNQIRHNPLQKV
jgi:hypothetical protein